MSSNSCGAYYTLVLLGSTGLFIFTCGGGGDATLSGSVSLSSPETSLSSSLSSSESSRCLCDSWSRCDSLGFCDGPEVLLVADGGFGVFSLIKLVVLPAGVSDALLSSSSSSSSS